MVTHGGPPPGPGTEGTVNLTDLSGELKGVFLSHRQSDSIRAFAVYLRLIANGIPAYLDEVDPPLEGDPERLTQRLREALYRCTHLLAVVSKATRGSWWVPFEIGLATERAYPIATYLLEDVDTPEYLRPWPYLRTQGDLDLYIEHLRQHSSMLTEGYRFNKSASDRSQDADEFHKRMKQLLGQ
jgi:hypothetical protein